MSLAARAAVIALASLVSPASPPLVADARALAAVPIPPGAVSRPVANDIVQNGRLVSIAALESDASPETLLAFYRERWPASEGSPGHLEESADGWRLLSRVEGETLVVLQLREGAGGAETFLSAMSLAPAAVRSVAPPPLPPGARLLSSTSARDGSRTAMTSIASSVARPGEIVAFYRDRLGRDGWSAVSDRAHESSHVLLLDGSDARLEIVVAESDGASVIVFNEVRIDE